MKRLFENIQDIYIKGSPSELSRIVTIMDQSLQNMSMATNQMFNILRKYSASNMGEQYKRVVETFKALNEVLSAKSYELNQMQNDVVEYQNKVMRYEDMTDYCYVPNPYLVENVQLDVIDFQVKFELNEMIEIENSLQEYGNFIHSNGEELIRGKNDIGEIWLDSQYQDFSEFIDEICAAIFEAITIYSEYVLVLEQKIKELNS